MSEEQKPSRPLSEIGHLFLSSVRQRQTNGAAMPRRQPPAPIAPRASEPNAGLPSAGTSSSDPGSFIPGAGSAFMPQRRDLSIDLTPEEFAQVYGEMDAAEPQIAGAQDATPNADEAPDPLAEPEVRIPPVTAVIASHLNGKQFDRVKEYARHLAAGGERVGLIEVDAFEFRVMCFDCPPQGGGEAGDDPTAEYFDARAMTAAIDELSWDLDRWLLVVSNPRTCEARDLLRAADHWVLLSTCDHDGVVSCYRTLKGLSDLHRPRLSLSLLNAAGASEACRVHRKIAGVCQQFLSWPLEPESPVQPADNVAEYLVMCCRPTRDKAQLAMAPQWQVVSDFLARAQSQLERAGIESNRPAPSPEAPHPSRAEPRMETQTPMDPTNSPIASPSVASPRPANPIPEGPYKMPAPVTPAAPVAAADPDFTDVVELTDGLTGAASILSAVLRGGHGELIECPVTPPMCPDAKLALTRDRRLVLLAVARPGLEDICSISKAYHWVVENLSLIGMALPQMAIDAAQTPRLRLLVDHADLTADALQPMLRSGVVEMQTYRRLRWGGKNGLLLEAA